MSEITQDEIEAAVILGCIKCQAKLDKNPSGRWICSKCEHPHFSQDMVARIKGLQVTVTKTTDERVFEDAAEAHEHQKELNLRACLGAIVGGFFFHNMSDSDIVNGLMEDIDNLAKAIKVHY